MNDLTVLAAAVWMSIAGLVALVVAMMRRAPPV